MHQRAVLCGSFIFLAFVAVLANSIPLCAQIDDSSSVRFTGQAVLTSDFYSLNSNPDGILRPRRPATLTRFVFTPSLSWGDLKLPATLVVSTQQTNVTTPRAGDQSLTQFLQNPMNKVSLSPQYKWVRLDLGTHIPQYSDLTTGSQQAFGAGIDITPGWFRLALFTGTSQRAIEPDSAGGIVGAYARRTVSGRMAFGSNEGTLFGLNAIRIEDDTNSIAPQSRGGLVPQEGVTGSFDLAAHVGKSLTMKGEFAGSAFSRNLRSAVVDDAPSVTEIITVRESTRFDFGALAEVDYDASTWGATLKADYLGDGFVPLGYPYAQTDMIEFSLAPRAQLLSRRLLLNGTVGYRVNNLQGTSLATSNQIIGMINVNARIGKKLILSGNYANFGFESGFDADTLKIRTVTQNFSLAPTLLLQGEKATNSITLAFGLSDFTEENTLTTSQSVNDMISLVGSWTVSLRTVPFSGSLSAGYVRNNLALGTLSIVSGSVGGSYRFFKGDLTPSLRLSCSRNQIGSVDPDSRVGGRLGLAWKAFNDITLNISGDVTSHTYGATRPGASYMEYLLRTGISTRF